MKGKVVLYIAASLDGYIARSSGSVDWLDEANSIEGEDYGYARFLESVGTVIMGRVTYDQVLSFGEYPYKGKESYVFSRREKRKGDENVRFVNEDVRSFVEGLDAENDIWLVGGAELILEFMKHDLVDEFIITIIPTLLGEGIPLFKQGFDERKLILEDSKAYDNGVVQLRYISR